MNSEIGDKSSLLQAQLDNIIDAFDSARQLNEVNNSMIKTNEVPENLGKLKKRFILDSFSLTKFEREFKEFQYNLKLETMNNENTVYNRIVGENSRLNSKYETSLNTFEKLKNQVEIPHFKISHNTLENLKDSELLQVTEKMSHNTLRNSNFELNGLFSIKKETSQLPFLEYSRVNKLINLEFRSRLQKRLKYELLTFVKNQLLYENKLWEQRVHSLNDFFNRPFTDVTARVEKIISESNENEEPGAESEDEEEGEEDEKPNSASEYGESHYDDKIQLNTSNENEGNEHEIKEQAVNLDVDSEELNDDDDESYTHYTDYENNEFGSNEGDHIQDDPIDSIEAEGDEASTQMKSDFSNITDDDTNNELK